jgi:hypothetical protein
VRSRAGFGAVPVGTEGVIDEHFGICVMVAWDLPYAPLPSGYREYDGVPMFISGRVRDACSADAMARYLEVIS